MKNYKKVMKKIFKFFNGFWELSRQTNFNRISKFKQAINKLAKVLFFVPYSCNLFCMAGVKVKSSIDGRLTSFESKFGELFYTTTKQAPSQSKNININDLLTLSSNYKVQVFITSNNLTQSIPNWQLESQFFPTFFTFVFGGSIFTWHLFPGDSKWVFLGIEK